MKAVDAAQPQRLIPPRPHLLKIGERLGRPGFFPVVDHVQQVAAIGARRPHLFGAARVSALWTDAALKGKIGQCHGWKRL